MTTEANAVACDRASEDFIPKNAMMILRSNAASPFGRKVKIAARALDRVVMWNHWQVPELYFAAEPASYWDKFGRPETKPKYDRGIVDTWWYDEAKAKRIANGN
jgi:ABC-type oligopeptide transport system substrate-binding subunit